MCIAIIYFPIDNLINFEINLIFSYQTVFLYDQKSQDQNLANLTHILPVLHFCTPENVFRGHRNVTLGEYELRMKRAFKVTEMKSVFYLLKGLKATF